MFYNEQGSATRKGGSVNALKLKRLQYTFKKKCFLWILLKFWYMQSARFFAEVRVVLF